MSDRPYAPLGTRPAAPNTANGSGRIRACSTLCHRRSGRRRHRAHKWATWAAVRVGASSALGKRRSRGTCTTRSGSGCPLPCTTSCTRLSSRPARSPRCLEGVAWCTAPLLALMQRWRAISRREIALPLLPLPPPPPPPLPPPSLLETVAKAAVPNAKAAAAYLQNAQAAAALQNAKAAAAGQKARQPERSPSSSRRSTAH